MVRSAYWFTHTIWTVYGPYAMDRIWTIIMALWVDPNKLLVITNWIFRIPITRNRSRTNAIQRNQYSCIWWRYRIWWYWRWSSKMDFRISRKRLSNELPTTASTLETIRRGFVSQKLAFREHFELFFEFMRCANGLQQALRQRDLFWNALQITILKVIKI